jgi:hypothetical protein
MYKYVGFLTTYEHPENFLLMHQSTNRKAMKTQLNIVRNHCSQNKNNKQLNCSAINIYKLKAINGTESKLVN